MLLPHVDDLDTRTAAGVLADGSPVPASLTALMNIAAILGHREIAKELLRRGALCSAVTCEGATPLRNVSSGGNLLIIALLLGRPGSFRMTPAELNLASGGGFNALHTAARSGYLSVCGLLVQAGASLDAMTNDGNSPLMVAQQCQPDNVPLHQLLSGNWTGPLPGTTCERCAAVPDSPLAHVLRWLPISGLLLPALRHGRLAVPRRLLQEEAGVPSSSGCGLMIRPQPLILVLTYLRGLATLAMPPCCRTSMPLRRAASRCARNV